MKQLEEQRSLYRAAGEEMAGELRACAGEEAEIQAALRGASEAVTSAEVAAQRLRDQAQETTQEAQAVGEALELSEQARAEEVEPLAPEQVQALSRPGAAAAKAARAARPGQSTGAGGVRGGGEQRGGA